MTAIDAWLEEAGSPFSNRVSKEWGMSPMMQRYMKSQTTSSASDSAFAIGSRNQAGKATINHPLNMLVVQVRVKVG